MTVTTSWASSVTSLLSVATPCGLRKSVSKRQQLLPKHNYILQVTVLTMNSSLYYLTAVRDLSTHVAPPRQWNWLHAGLAVPSVGEQTTTPGPAVDSAGSHLGSEIRPPGYVTVRRERQGRWLAVLASTTWWHNCCCKITSHSIMKMATETYCISSNRSSRPVRPLACVGERASVRTTRFTNKHYLKHYHRIVCTASDFNLKL